MIAHKNSTMVTFEESNRIAQTVQVSLHSLQVIVSDVRWFNMVAIVGEEGFVPEQQPIMCDFDIVKDDINPARFFISLVLEMENRRNGKERLFFDISTVTEFEYTPEGQSSPLPNDESKRWQLFHVALSAAISSTRGYLTNYLAPTPYRGYLLPLLNVKDLVNRKFSRQALPAVPSKAPSEKPNLAKMSTKNTK
jgi:hypothetical protein